MLPLVVALACAAGVRAWRRRGPVNVLVVTLDTLRADRVGSYGYAAAKTPVLDALAARGARFASATTTTPLTLSAHTSLFTGTWPTAHGVRDNTGFYVDDGVTTLAEVLKARGYRTGGFVGAFVLDGRWGIAQGFDTLLRRVRPRRRTSAPGSTRFSAAAARWWTRRWPGWASPPAQPFFGWVHLYDPHTPYDAPGRLRVALPRHPRRRLRRRDGLHRRPGRPPAGRPRGRRPARATRSSWCWPITASSSASTGSSRTASSSTTPSVQIPLIIAGPGVTPRVVPDQVRIVDVMPTVLDLAGRRRCPPAVQGASLRPALDGQRQELLAFSETWYPRFHYGWSELQAVRDGALQVHPRADAASSTTSPRIPAS